MHQMHYSSSDSRATIPFALVHSDLWGPSPHISSDGYIYYMYFIDDYNHYIWIFPLKAKSDAYKLFVQFNVYEERKFAAKIKCLQTD